MKKRKLERMVDSLKENKSVIICIDLKSFYASVECVERGLDPFKTNLVVADPTRSKSTICLAITPAMKALGIRNRCRIHEIPENIEYITAMPRMQLYIDYSAKIYGIYLRYVPTGSHRKVISSTVCLTIQSRQIKRDIYRRRC